MRVGTKSLLFGVHSLLWHPIMVLIAWYKLYGLPSWKEVICIIIHDWGYWGKPNMDGREGQQHPIIGADFAMILFGDEYWKLCILHSRHYAKNMSLPPSRLCWADKLSILYEPKRFYLFRARLSGELEEYRSMSHKNGELLSTASDEEWFSWIQTWFASEAISHAHI